MKKILLLALLSSSLASAAEFRILCAQHFDKGDSGYAGEAIAGRLTDQIKELGTRVLDVSMPTSAATNNQVVCVTVKLK